MSETAITSTSTRHQSSRARRSARALFERQGRGASVAQPIAGCRKFGEPVPDQCDAGRIRFRGASSRT